MTKAEIVKQIAGQTGLESKMVAGVVEALLERIRAAQIGGQNVYFRGFGSFVRRERAAKKARDISRNTTVLVPAHTVPQGTRLLRRRCCAVVTLRNGFRGPSVRGGF